jgi:hypothetical protein
MRFSLGPSGWFAYRTSHRSNFLPPAKPPSYVMSAREPKKQLVEILMAIARASLFAWSASKPVAAPGANCQGLVAVPCR